MHGPILVVDDDVDMQATIAAILADEGYEVRVAGDGLDALSRIEEAPPALILLDITMPRMDGYAFADELRRRGQHPDIPIVVLTADGRAPEKAARVRAAGYVAKPFALTDLLDTVARYTA
jgi:CheY-like chemotaxis protein